MSGICAAGTQNSLFCISFAKLVLFRLGLLLFLQQGVKTCKRLVPCDRPLALARVFSAIPLRISVPGMLVVVAVDTQQLPVASVGGVVVVVMIPVMNRKFF